MNQSNILDEIVRDFIVEKIQDFPRLCMETRQINRIHDRDLELHGNKTPTRMVGGEVSGGTSGWSRDGNFKARWIIPMQLKFFMRNFIYIGFWDDSNSKVRDSFMKAVLRGDDSLTLLKKVRDYYGNNSNNKTEEIKVMVE